MTPLKDGLHKFSSMQSQIFLGDDFSLLTLRHGDLHITPKTLGGFLSTNVLYISGLHYHLISIYEL